MPKGDFKTFESSTKDGNTVLAKLLHAALDEAPLPVDVRRVCGVITRSSFGNWNFGENRRSISCELSAVSLADTLQLRLGDLVHALGKLVEWRLVRTSWLPTSDHRRTFRFAIEKHVNRWVVPGFDAERARQVFLNERKVHVAKLRSFKPRRDVQVAEADPSPIIQAHRELFRGRDPLVMTPPVLEFHRAAADMISCVGRPGSFQDAARRWLSMGNTLMGWLAGRGWIPGVGPGELDRRGAARLEAWLLERLQVDRVFKERQEFLLEKKVRALLDVEPRDPLGHVKVMVGRGLILDWIWLQELHGFDTAKVTRAARPGRSLAEAWLGLTPDQLLGAEKSKKPAFLRFLRCLSRGAQLEKHGHEDVTPGKRVRKAQLFGTPENPGLTFPAGATITNRQADDHRVPMVLRLRVTKLAGSLDDAARMCTKHGLEILERVSESPSVDVLSTEHVTTCTEKRSDIQSSVQLIQFLDQEIGKIHTFHNFHIVRTVSSVVGRYSGLVPYKNYHFQARDGLNQSNFGTVVAQNNGVAPSALSHESTRTDPASMHFVQNTGSKTSRSTGVFVRGHGTLCKKARYPIGIGYRATQDPEPISKDANKQSFRTGKTSSIPTLGTEATRDELGETQKFETLVWTPDVPDRDVHWVLSGLEYLLGWRGWRPVSGGPFPVRRRTDSLPPEESIPVGLGEAELSAPPAAPAPPAVAIPAPPLVSPQGGAAADDELPPPLPVDPALLRLGEKSLVPLAQALRLDGTEPVFGASVLEDPEAAEGASTAKRTASYRSLDANQFLVDLDKAIQAGQTPPKECLKCHECHGPLDVCVNLKQIHEEVGLPYTPGQYRESSVEELRQMPEAEFWARLGPVEAPGPRHEDPAMGYGEGQDTLDLFHRCIGQMGEPQAEWAERFFDLDFACRWIQLYDRIPFFSNDQAAGRRYKYFPAGLRMHMESLMPLIAKVRDLTAVKRAYAELYLTPERRLRNQEGTLDTYVRLLTAVLAESYPSIVEVPFEAPRISDPGLSVSIEEFQRTDDSPKLLSELLVLTNGELMSILAEGSMKHVKDGDLSRLDLSGIPELAREDSSVIKFLMEVAHGKWIALMPDLIRKSLFDTWFNNKMRYEHFRIVVRFYRALRRAGFLVYDALPEQYKLDKLPFLTNEAALRAAIAGLEKGPVKSV